MPEVRIHQIAKELGASSKEVIDRSVKLGMKVTSHQDIVSAADAGRIKKAFINVPEGDSLETAEEQKETVKVFKFETGHDFVERRTGSRVIRRRKEVAKPEHGENKVSNGERSAEDDQIDDGTDVGEQTGLEHEDVDPDVEIKHPFDPEKIRVKTVQVVVDQLVSRIEYEEINLTPDFQRAKDIWKPRGKSRLIESLLLRIPLPVFYVASDDEDNWDVVDGIQRMSTIYDYVKAKFPLRDLEYLVDNRGKKFDDLPRPLQRRIKETQLIVNVIEPGTPEEVKFNIFHRINTGGITLNGQEIRHALHKGTVRDYLKKLAETEEFLRATKYSIKSERMSDRECVLRFLAFYIEPWEKYTKSNLDGHLGEAMNKINRMTEEQRDSILKDFKKAMCAAYAIFSENAFRKPSSDGKSKPINKALLEAWSVQLARCSDREIETLVAEYENLNKKFIGLIETDQEFQKAISYSTGDRRRVEKRFSTIQGLIGEFVQ